MDIKKMYGTSFNSIKRMFGYKNPATTIQADFSDFNNEAAPPRLEAMYSEYQYTPIIQRNFTGEKNFGELGAAVNYLPDYNILALRSWQAYMESELAKLVIDNYILWVIGSGLRLQSEPKFRILKQENVNVSASSLQDFTADVEARFNLHAESRYSSYSRLQNLHFIAEEAQKNAIISGDCLVVFRFFQNGGLNAQLVDGQKIMTPITGHKFIEEAANRGNTVRHGVEINPRGGHVAFFVREVEGTKVVTKRIPAMGAKTGRTSAFLVYGSKYRLDYVRGLPLIACVLETMKKLDRYKEATVGSAEERQKIALFIEHQLQAEGENPFIKDIRNSVNLNGAGIDNDTTIDDDLFNTDARRIAATTGKTALNLAPGSTMKALESKNELYFKEFYETNINVVCATLGIPPEVALMKYESSFSAARMATKSWEFSLNVRRKHFSFQFYQPFYNLWLQMEILKGKINAPKYIENIRGTEKIVILAYQNSRFIGPNVPHVDPVKETKAELMKLGDSYLPITTHAKVSEKLNEGDWEDNIQRIKKEKEEYGEKEQQQSNQV